MGGEDCCPVIVNYRQSDATVASIDAAHGKINKADCAAKDAQEYSIWLLRWVFIIIQAVVVIIGGQSAINEELKAGEYVVLVKASIDFGKILVKTANLVQTFFTGAASVRKIAKLLNRTTRRQNDAQFRTQQQSSDEKQAIMNIRVEKLTYTYQTGSNIVVAVPPITFSFDPGQLVCLPRGNTWSNAARDVGVNTLFSLMTRFGHE